MKKKIVNRGFVVLALLSAVFAAQTLSALCAPIGRILDGIDKPVYVGLDLSADQAYEEMARTRLAVTNGILDVQDVAAAQAKLGPLQTQVAELIAAKRLISVAYNTKATLVDSANPSSPDALGSNPYCQVRLLSGERRGMVVWTQHYEDLTPIVGEVCYVAIDGSLFAPTGTDQAALDSFMKAAERGDNPVADRLIKAQKIIALKNNVKCTVIASSDENEDTQFRVLEGLYKGKTLWTPTKFLTTQAPPPQRGKKRLPAKNQKQPIKQTIKQPIQQPIIIPASAPR